VASEEVIYEGPIASYHVLFKVYLGELNEGDVIKLDIRIDRLRPLYSGDSKNPGGMYLIIAADGQTLLSLHSENPKNPFSLRYKMQESAKKAILGIQGVEWLP